MPSILGNNLILYVWDGTAYRPVACVTSNALNQTKEIIESQTKCDPNEIIKTSSTRSYSINADGEYIDTTSTGGETTKASHDYLMGLYNQDTPFTWRMSTGLTDTTNYYGSAIISDLSLTGDANQISTFSTTFEGSGAIVTVDPNA